MPGLRALQTAFSRHLVDGDPDIAAHIATPRGPSAGRRLSIYANAYHARLAEALATDYPALQTVLGEEAFAQICRAYVEVHPSTFTSLRWVGRDLPAFLARTRAEEPHLAELAGFEWNLAAAFGAPDAPVTGIEAASRLPGEAWPTLRLRLHPSVHHYTLDWNTLARWRAAKDGEPIPAAQRLPERGACLVWRERLTTRYRSMESDEITALAAATAGVDFSEICSRLATRVDDEKGIALRAAGLLKGWLDAGLVRELIA